MKVVAAACRETIEGGVQAADDSMRVQTRRPNTVIPGQTKPRTDGHCEWVTEEIRIIRSAPIRHCVMVAYQLRRLNTPSSGLTLMPCSRIDNVMTISVI